MGAELEGIIAMSPKGCITTLSQSSYSVGYVTLSCPRLREVLLKQHNVTESETIFASLNAFVVRCQLLYS